MRTDEFDYALPKELVAQRPAARRDASRLMILDRARDGVVETTFERIADELRPGDLVVLNDTRVLPARLEARKTTGGRVEILLLERDASANGACVFSCLLSNSKGMARGARLVLPEGLEAELQDDLAGGRPRLRFSAPGGADPEPALRRIAAMPLPPYIRREAGDAMEALDRERYQTVYADSDGAVAAPTAGLHFTPELLARLAGRGVPVHYLTLHVGPGTFRPIRAGRVEDHRLEAEPIDIPEATAEAVERARREGRRVVAVGTTTTRALEWAAGEDGRVRARTGPADLFIRPGHRFRVVDALLTNFHLPRSSLLVLVSAFAGRDSILAAYRHAVATRYRFYSYGDAMLIV